MNIELTAHEARTLGVLLEKEATTPDAYPLSINAIVGACNQKSNREPVMELSESDAQNAIDGLVGHTLAREQGGAGGRVPRYAHRLASRLFGELEFSEAERAVLCILLLRGPQTPGEIRTRSARLFAFENVQQTENVLSTLAGRSDGPYLTELAREPGRRESRYMHLFCGGTPAHTAPAPTQPPAGSPAPASAPAPSRSPSNAVDDEVAALRQRLDTVEAQVATLREQMSILIGPEDD